MITEYDVQALIELLQRTPMTKPEQLFAGRLVETLMGIVENPTDSPAKEEEPEAKGAEDADRHDAE